MTTTHFNFYHLLVTTCSEGRAPEKRYIRFFLIRWTMNKQACQCLMHKCLPMPANACQNLYIVRWTLIYIRLLLLFKNPPSPCFSTFEKKLCIHNDTVAVECVSCRFLGLCTLCLWDNNNYLNTLPLSLLVLLKDFYVYTMIHQQSSAWAADF